MIRPSNVPTGQPQAGAGLVAAASRWQFLAAAVPSWVRHCLRPVMLTLVLGLSLGLAVPAPLWGLEPAAASPDRATLQAGARLFEAHCAGCHGGGGNIIRRGRTLKLAALERAGLASPEAIARVAAAGIGQMSGYGTVLGEGGSERVAAWVWSQAQAGWPRPVPISADGDDGGV